ncbi:MULTISPECIES: YceI family protein [unclassified Saccharicrinis]|uniref:YceI family protein n=1 Tax=unclassified Saccharicrinis TaxID=2646859 RepID=UPI003D351950
MYLNKVFVIILLFFAGHKIAQAQIYNGTGTVDFFSVAPLETIKASSDQLRGLLNLENQTFAFVLSVQSFEGFNSPLQKEHFNEHYLETKKYPKTEFSGKMIGMDECGEPCKKTIYAKGKLKLHGITRVITVPVSIERKDGIINATADFKVLLYNFDITVPRILESKIAPEISVRVNLVFTETDE